MRLLLDTHVLLWWMAGDQRLRPTHRSAIGDLSNTVAISAVSVWEISIKQALGGLSVPPDYRQALAGLDLDELDITVDDAVLAGSLPRHHTDPFDRMLIAQAIRRDLRLVTAGRAFAAYEVPLLA